MFLQQIDFGEETGPRTVVSGLVNYIPIDQMRDRYLIGVVRRNCRRKGILLNV
jgi:aminoacyl tRNA synthase complex-interacting multifunctional protein 1